MFIIYLVKALFTFVLICITVMSLLWKKTDFSFETLIGKTTTLVVAVLAITTLWVC